MVGVPKRLSSVFLLSMTLLLPSYSSFAQDRGLSVGRFANRTPIIASGRHEVQGGKYAEKVALKRGGLLFLTANGTALFSPKGDRRGFADLLLTISINGEVCSRDRSMLAEASNVRLYSSASCVIWLPRGTSDLRAEISSNDRLRQILLTVDYYVISTTAPDRR